MVVIFDFRRSPNVLGGGRASGKKRKRVFALLHAQQPASLEGAESGTTRKKCAFL